MLYVDAIRILEKIAQARFLHATMPKQEEIEEAIKVVASQVTVQACPGFALHGRTPKGKSINRQIRRAIRHWETALPFRSGSGLPRRCGHT